MKLYLGTDSRSATATHATVRHLTCRVEGLGHKLFMDNFFEADKGQNKGKDQGKFDCVSLEGQTRRSLAD